MTVAIALNAAGGLALFLLAMQMMTDGLKSFAGGGLKQLLGRFTSTPLKGVLAGILVTGLVQSSSAVTVATIGFVNAGLLTLRQALGVIYGTNVGTTVTGWLVSLVGFGVKIESFALPILAAGVALRLIFSTKRTKGLGDALAGFGLFFLGLAILKDSFGTLAETYGSAVAGGSLGGNLLTFLLIGFVATVLTQSSSAAIAIILTAASGSVIDLQSAAAAVIGANLGTTSTATIAVLHATAHAKRLAVGHVLFNIITGAVALALLPLLIWLVGQLAHLLDMEGSPALALALFHTVFNVLGVIIMLPLGSKLSKQLERMFRSQEEETGRPQYLDATLAAIPDLAVAALHTELMRLRGMVVHLVCEVVRQTDKSIPAVERQTAGMRGLVTAIAGFVGMIRTESMSREVGDQLARALRIARYLDEAARLAATAMKLKQELQKTTDPELVITLGRLFEQISSCCDLARAEKQVLEHDDSERLIALEAFEHHYQQSKSRLLAAAVSGQQSIDIVARQLDDLSSTRRMVEQLVKADRLLRTPSQAEVIESEKRQDGP